MTLQSAKEVLRIDADDTANDVLITGLVNSIPDYIELTTGMAVADQTQEPLCDTVGGFLLTLWYFSDHADDKKLQRTIDNLLKCISLKAFKKVTE